ncbi:hypothetical protein K6025_05025 [Ehrlichia sp. JZT12]
MLVYNLAEESYTYMRKSLHAIDRTIYSQAYDISKNFEKIYCANLKSIERGLAVFFNIICALLQETSLVEAVPSSNVIIPKIKEHVAKAMNILVEIHNFFIINQHDTDKLKNFLKYLDKEAVYNVRAIESWCRALIKTSNITSSNFVYAAACVSSMAFTTDQLYYRLSNAISFKRRLLLSNRPLCFSGGVKGKDLVRIDLEVYKPDVDKGFWIHFLQRCCKNSKVACKNFILEHMKRRYGCSIEEVKTAINDAGGVLAPWMQIVVTGGRVKLTIQGESMFSIEAPSSSSSYAAFLAGGEGSSNDFSSSGLNSGPVQQVSYNQNILPGTEDGQKNFCASSSNNVVSRQLCNQLLREDCFDNDDDFYSLLPDEARDFCMSLSDSASKQVDNLFNNSVPKDEMDFYSLLPDEVRDFCMNLNGNSTMSLSDSPGEQVNNVFYSGILEDDMEFYSSLPGEVKDFCMSLNGNSTEQVVHPINNAMLECDAELQSLAPEEISNYFMSLSGNSTEQFYDIDMSGSDNSALADVVSGFDDDHNSDHLSPISPIIQDCDIIDHEEIIVDTCIVAAISESCQQQQQR